MKHIISSFERHDTPSLPGFVGWLVVVLWFLLTVMSSVKAEESAMPAPISLTASDLLPELEAALIEKGVSPDAQINLAAPNAIVADASNAEIVYTSYNPGSGRFVARLSNNASITGEALMIRSVPVINRQIGRGDLITEDAIDYLETPMAPRAVVILDSDEIIGMEARRALAAGSAITTRDVVAPIVVKKGALITLTYAIDGLKLSHQGVAQSNGGAGDIISVKNIQSDRILKAIVMREGLARVAAPSNNWEDNI